MRRTMVVSVFAGCGKTWLTNHQNQYGYSMRDSDSSTYEKTAGWEKEYINSFMEEAKSGKYDFIFVCQTESVIDEMDRQKIPYVIVEPDNIVWNEQESKERAKERQIIKQQWFGRFILRDNSHIKNFSKWLNHMKDIYDERTGLGFIVKHIFFDFDDTLFTHYVNQQFGDDDVIMTSLLQAETKEQGSGYRVYDTLGKPNQLMQIFIEEETDKIPKFCITWVADSIMLKFKKQWLDKYYPGKITDLVGTSSPERKIKTMQIIASAYGVPSNKVLFVDDKYDTVAQAIKHGFCAMTTIEVMTKMYEKYGEKH